MPETEPCITKENTLKGKLISITLKPNTMKWSIYNTTGSAKDGNTLLYNYAKDSILVLLPELYKIVKEHDEKADGIKNIHPELYAALCENGFIVEEDADEAEQAMLAITEKLATRGMLHLIINPTLDCNLRCWYCYEEHTKNCYMNEETMRRIIMLADREARRDELHTISLSFFGGEPLLKADRIAIPLIREIKKICSEHDKNLKVHFTSNAVLLSEKTADELAALDVYTHFQIPFDGGRSMHDKTKAMPGGKGTYAIVLNNVSRALAKGFSVTVRCNYTDENIGSFKELADDISLLPGQYRERIWFSIHRVWQVTPTEGLNQKEKELREYITGKGLTRNTEHQKVLTNCYADYDSTMVINYNGDVFKCTARDFNHENRIGTLEEDGTVTETDKSRLYRTRRFCKECRTCKILPICTICTQKRIENGKCPIDITPQEAERQLQTRLQIQAEDSI